MENIAAIFITSEKNRKGMMKISFRSNKKYPHKGLCEKIAKHFRGGGHKTAASCYVKRKIVKKWKVNYK